MTCEAILARATDPLEEFLGERFMTSFSVDLAVANCSRARLINDYPGVCILSTI
jgi:hypothetical protein